MFYISDSPTFGSGFFALKITNCLTRCYSLNTFFIKHGVIAHSQIVSFEWLLNICTYLEKAEVLNYFLSWLWKYLARHIVGSVPHHLISGCPIKMWIKCSSDKILNTFQIIWRSSGVVIWENWFWCHFSGIFLVCKIEYRKCGNKWKYILHLPISNFIWDSV